MKNKKTNLKKEFYIRILVLIILLLLLTITSFNTGRKFYLLQNTYFETTKGQVDSGVARCNFKAKEKINVELISYEN